VKSIAILVVAVALAPVRLHAQATFTPSANPVSDSVRGRLGGYSKNLVASAELMPADKYGYHPTPAQMTFGQLIVHIVQTNVVICSMIGGTPPLDVMKLTDAEPKDVLVAKIRESFDHCSRSLAKVTDAGLGEEVSMFGKPAGMSRATAMITITVDWADHYSTAASYLRMNGILPPSAQQKP